jgi:hypothetical protein
MVNVSNNAHIPDILSPGLNLLDHRKFRVFLHFSNLNVSSISCPKWLLCHVTSRKPRADD